MVVQRLLHNSVENGDCRWVWGWNGWVLDSLLLPSAPSPDYRNVRDVHGCRPILLWGVRKAPYMVIFIHSYPGQQIVEMLLLTCHITTPRLELLFRDIGTESNNNVINNDGGSTLLKFLFFFFWKKKKITRCSRFASLPLHSSAPRISSRLPLYSVLGILSSSLEPKSERE